MPLGGYSFKPLFEEGDAAEYASCLHHFTEIPVDSLFEPPDKVLTWLRKPTGEPNYISVADYPHW
jgi:hypothetical protein